MHFLRYKNDINKNAHNPKKRLWNCIKPNAVKNTPLNPTWFVEIDLAIISTDAGWHLNQLFQCPRVHIVIYLYPHPKIFLTGSKAESTVLQHFLTIFVDSCLGSRGPFSIACKERDHVCLYTLWMRKCSTKNNSRRASRHAACGH